MIPPELYRNQQTYQQLAQALSLGLRRQIWVAVCDNRYWRDRLIDRLAEQHPQTTTEEHALITITLNPDNPELNPLLAISQWLKAHQQNVNPHKPPTFALVGIEHLTLQSSQQQRRFLKHLKFIADAYVPKMDFNLLLWLPRPWMNSIMESVPAFWQWRTGLFEFQGEPTPVKLYDLPKPERFFPAQDQQFFDRYFHTSEQQILASPTNIGSEEEAWNLSQQYRSAIHEGDTSVVTLELAIESYQQLFEYLPTGDRRLGDLYNDIGNFTWLLARQETDRTTKQQHLQQSIEYYQQALATVTESPDAEFYAMVQNNLGAVYSDLAYTQGNVAPLQQAVQAYEAALQHRSPETDTLRYVSTQNNLGTVYWHLAQQENAAQHLQGAISCYKSALSYLSKTDEPSNWAMMQNNLGTAYLNLSQHQDPVSCLQVAIAAYNAALEFRTPETNPVGCASTHNNLGTSYWQLSVYVTEDSGQWQNILDKAIASYEVALSLYHLLNQEQPAIAVDFDVLETLNNKGLIHYQLATEIVSPLESDDKIQHLQDAIKAHSLSLSKQVEDTPAYEDSLSYLIGGVRTLYEQGGIVAQNQALSEVPSYLLPKILPRL
ncbi:tetratricopeptide domain-containing protein [[Leptolyngbya] sp. PCC 7376]|uniref:tetratricopeptide repeat protein n=1 Tax=[Leptolyngbya] sp. PCC 7376 TaxID=111781 RepID=UPI00029F33DE|nr:tetratricopeptide repeat protein [[Leptolyngbya] sp. PCC 7376]AFY38674.1 tetratricopeptide domain-containing protein [[Leptolyngbya] sp. PCC 7376]